MDYLKIFTDFISSGKKYDIQIFEDSVKQDLLKTKADFEKDGLIIDIEPVKVTEQTEETKQHHVHHYKGTFIYGFQKNGIFHQVPGDISTKIERKQNESGEMIFHINKQTNKVDMISETFAGNSWGEKQKKKRKYNFWGIMGSILLIFIIGGNIYDNLKPQIASFAAEWALREYKDDIATCVTETKKELGDKKVVGIEYECAISVASTFYNSDPEKAIQLCMVNNPFFDIQLGREYSSLNTDDLYAQKNEQIARTSCKLSIERRLEKKELPMNVLQTETYPDVSDEVNQDEISTISSDVSFTNQKYGYSLSLLPTETAISNQYATEASNAFNVTVTDEKDNFLANITTLDLSMFHGEEEGKIKIRESFNLPLNEYVEHISELNKENLDLPMQESRPIGGISGYTISIRNSFNDERGGYLFTDNYPIHAFIFLEYNGLKYQFEIPESLGHRGGKILNSLKFK